VNTGSRIVVENKESLPSNASMPRAITYEILANGQRARATVFLDDCFWTFSCRQASSIAFHVEAGFDAEGVGSAGGSYFVAHPSRTEFSHA